MRSQEANQPPGTGQRWLVTGASGQLGGHVLTYLRTKRPAARVRAWCGRRSVALAGVDADAVDLAADDLGPRLQAAQPTHVLHLGALTAIATCYEQPAHAERVNVDATRQLAEAAVAAGARFVFTSTDMVFDGEHAPYGEKDPPAPRSAYGRSKAAAESTVRDAGGLIARLPLLYGCGALREPTGFERQLAAARAGEPLRLFTDEFRSPAALPDAARALVHLAELTTTGVVHIAGPQRLSRYELIAQSAALLGIDMDSLEAVRQAELTFPEPRPRDLTLRTEHLRALLPDALPGPLRVGALQSGDVFD